LLAHRSNYLIQMPLENHCSHLPPTTFPCQLPKVFKQILILVPGLQRTCNILSYPSELWNNKNTSRLNIARICNASVSRKYGQRKSYRSNTQRSLDPPASSIINMRLTALCHRRFYFCRLLWNKKSRDGNG